MKVLSSGMLLLLLAAPWTYAAATDGGTVDHLTGDGRLTAGIDERGRLTYLRWPSPEGWEHVGYGEGDGQRAAPGAGWLVRAEESWGSLGAEGWSIKSDYTTPESLVVSTQFTGLDGGRSAVQKLLVWPGEDVVGVQLRLTGFPADTRIAWYEDFAPSTHNVTGGSHLERPVRPERDFAAWYDATRTTLVHFRPQQPGRAQWAQAHDRRDAEPSDGGWDEFGTGVYLSFVSPNQVLGVAVGRSDAPLPDAGARHAVGPVHARLELAPEPRGDELVAEVFIGFGSTSAEARVRAMAALHAEWPAVLMAAERTGSDWLRGARGIVSDASFHRNVLNLLLCVDRASGAVRYEPSSGPAGAVARVFDSVWASAALDSLGYTDGAARALQVHLDSARLEFSDGQPAGSLPAAIYCTGEAARFDGTADPASAAWLLAGCWRHAISLPEDGVGAYLESVTPVLAACAEYLAREPGVGRALLGGGAAAEAPLSLLETHFLGLESWRRILALRGTPEPGVVADRRSELLYLIRIRRQNDVASEQSANPWIGRWLRELWGLGAEASAGWEGLVDDGALRRLPETWRADSTTPIALRDALRCLGGVRRQRQAGG